MDKIDLRILKLLQHDARMSYKDLGEKVNLSANTVAERIRHLISKRIIENFTAEIDLGALGLRVEALIDVKLASGTSAKQFEKAIQTIPGILEATLLTGKSDYMLRVACTDQLDLVRLIESLRERAGVQETQSHLILKKFDVQSVLNFGF